MHSSLRTFAVYTLLAAATLAGCRMAYDSTPTALPATDPAATLPAGSPPAGTRTPETNPTRAPASATASLSPSASATSEGATEVTIGTPPSSETIYRPDSATVVSGQLVRLIFVNSSTTPHNVTFDAPIDAATDAYIAPGQSGGVTFTAPAAGEYRFYCTLHPWMTGTLTVTR